MNKELYNLELLKEVLEHTSDLFCVTKSNYEIIESNLSFDRFFGNIEANSTLTTFIEIPKNDATTFRGQVLDLSTGRQEFIDWRKIIDTKNNTILWLGKIDMKHKINRLEETDRMGKIGIWEYDIATQAVFWSKEVYKIHGEPLGKKIPIEAGLNYYHKEDLPIISEIFTQAIENGQPFEQELRIITAANQVKWVRTIGERVEKNGKPIKIKGTFQDIHRTKIAELKVKQSRILLQQILDALPVGVFWKNTAGVYLGFNKLCEKFTKRPPKSLIGKTDAMLIDDPILLKQVQMQDEVIIKDKKMISETHVIRTSETNAIIELKKLPLFNEKQEVFGIVGVYIDITKLQTLIRNLKTKNDELKELLFAASNDLKAPLQGISKFAQLLKRRYNITLETHGNQMLDYILREAKRQHEQFNGLTKFLKIGSEERVIKQLNLYDIINDAIKNIDFETYNFPEFEVVFNDLPKIFYNEYDLEIIFYELINNAIKFRQLNQPLEIEISVVAGDEFWEVIFEDNGEGFDMELKEKVFMIFQKLHNKYYYDGPGIGLSICKKIVEKYGGKIEVHSKKLKGTTFKFTIPKIILQEDNSLN